VSIMTPSSSTTSTIVAPTNETIAPESSPATPEDFIVTPDKATITPVTTDTIGIDPPAITRFPVPPDTSQPTGMTRVAFPKTVFGSMEGSDHVLKLQSDLITAPPVSGLSLQPKTATNPVGTSHTVTATVEGGTSGVKIDFNVTAGPNQGASGSATTNTSGAATFTYKSNGAVGTDTIIASGTVNG